MRRPRPGPKTRALAVERLQHVLARHTSEDRLVIDLEAAIPDAWALLEADVPCT